ncbi:MAG: AAA family ATPase [Pseudomonadota bacterium]
MHPKLNALLEEINTVILGKPHELRLALCCLLARGHLLLEDLPGMGKTTLSQTLAAVLGLSHNRVQFTSDILPSDITGAMVFEQQSATFSFHRGPIFCQVLLADELNRATPKAQSALLQAMEENQVSVDSDAHALPEPFFVIATQNPVFQNGTYPLPESQLDRFLMRLSLGYPDAQAERHLLRGDAGRVALESVTQVCDAEAFTRIQNDVANVHLSESLLDYVQRLVAGSREPELCELGLSPRGAMYLVRAAQAWALLHGRDHVLPEDVQAVFTSVVSHRMIGQGQSGEAAARKLMAETNVIQ